MSESISTRHAIRGCDIHCRHEGSGPPLLFLRGFDIGTDTAPFVTALAQEARVIVPDHPGFGASSLPDWLRGMGDMAYFYLDFLESLELRDVHIVGAGIGAWIAAEIAIRDSSRLSRLSLIGPAGLRHEGGAFGDPFIRAPEALNDFLFSAGNAPQAESANDDSTIDLRLKNAFGLARIAWQPRLASPELARWIHRVRVPVDLVWGSADRVIPIAHAGAWTNALPGASLATIEGAGHLAHVERPADVAAAILRARGGNA